MFQPARMAKRRARRPNEIELKLSVPATALRELEESPTLRAAARRARVERLTSVYYDTDKHTLSKRGLSLRVRSNGRRHVQTIKADNYSSSGLAKRSEWETVVSGNEPDLDAARGTVLEPLISKRFRRSLKPIFETRVERKVFPLRNTGASIEVAVDQGEIVTGDRSAEISEVELELKDGDRPDRLFELAGTIADTIPVHLEVRSKAERGYALVQGKEPEPQGAQSVVLSAKATVGEAFRDIARSALRQVAANEAAVNRDDPEGVHQMRVGLRRLRATISLFRPIFGDRQTGRIKRELKWLADALGPARQLAVFDERVISSLRRAEFSQAAIDALSDDVAHRRSAAAAHVKETLVSRRYRRLLLDVAEWIDAGEWLNTDQVLIQRRRDGLAIKFARSALRSRTRRLVKRGSKLRRLDPDRRHKLRIAAKKLRYACESFASLFPGKKAERKRKAFIDCLRRLQDSLGALNDVTADSELSAAIAQEGPLGGQKRTGRFEYVAGIAAGYEEAQRKALLRSSIQAHRRFSKAAGFWT
jgi:inorganic triphosphatase YgiF